MVANKHPLDKFKLEYEDMKPETKTKLRRRLGLKFKKPGLIRAYFNYMVAVILK